MEMPGNIPPNAISNSPVLLLERNSASAHYPISRDGVIKYPLLGDVTLGKVSILPAGVLNDQREPRDVLWANFGQYIHMLRR